MAFSRRDLDQGLRLARQFGLDAPQYGRGADLIDVMARALGLLLGD